VLTNAAREGARVAVLPGYGSADVVARVDEYLETGGLTGATTTTLPATPVAIGGVCMTLAGVRVTYPHTFMFLGPIVGLLGGGGFTDKTLSVEARMRYEGGALECP
jgi:hypothetical protein